MIDMNALDVITESPEIEQWRLLSQFTYPPNIRKQLDSRGFAEINPDVVELVAGSFRQGEAYFASAKTSPLDISPLLLYYGATNLLAGTYALLTNSRPHIKNHGMRISSARVEQVAQVSLVPQNPESGALQEFCSLFSPGCNLPTGGAWMMHEIMGSLPDLRFDFENQYLENKYFTVPIEIVYTRDRKIERILNRDLERYDDLAEVLSHIPKFAEAYLKPQFKPNYIILFPRQNRPMIGTYSTSGRKYLQIAHKKNGQMLCPDPIIFMFMGLFILGMLPRYYPELWNPFVRSDITGERFIVEKFTSLCHRYFPNLVLNFIYGKRVQFITGTEGIRDMRLSFTEQEFKAVVKEVIQQMRIDGEL